MKDITHHEDFLTQHSISLSPEQTDRLSSAGWMAKINLLTSPSPNTRFGREKKKSIRNIVSPSGLVQSGPAVVEIDHPLQRDIAPQPALRLLSGYFLTCLAFRRPTVVPGYKHGRSRLYERGHAKHNSPRNSRNADPGLVWGRQFVLTSASRNADEKRYHQQLILRYLPTKPRNFFPCHFLSYL